MHGRPGLRGPRSKVSTMAVPQLKFRREILVSFATSY